MQLGDLKALVLLTLRKSTAGTATRLALRVCLGCVEEMS